MNFCAHENIGRIIFFIKIKFIIGLVIWLCIHAGEFISVMSVFEPKIKNDLKMILENYFGRKKKKKRKRPRGPVPSLGPKRSQRAPSSPFALPSLTSRPRSAAPPSSSSRNRDGLALPDREPIPGKP